MTKKSLFIITLIVILSGVISCRTMDKKEINAIDTIGATEDKAASKDTQTIASECTGKPKFIILIKENILGTESMPGFTQTEIMIRETLENFGFAVIPPATARMLIEDQRKKENAAIKKKQSDNIPKLFIGEKIADVMILGTTTTTDQTAELKKYGLKMKSHKAVIKLKAAEIYSGVWLASISKEAAGVHINPKGASIKAIENTLKLIMEAKDRSGKFVVGPFLDAIIKKVSLSNASTNREICLIVNGLDKDDLPRFKEEICQKISGVNGVISRDSIANISKISVFYTGDTCEFLDKLDKQSNQFEYDIRVRDVIADRISIQVKKR